MIDNQRMRIAVVSSPRSGNSWVRSVLRDALGLQDILVHNPRDVPAELSERLILQLHWYREPHFQRLLRTNGFRVLVIARHPIDLLISAWHFAPFEPETARWLEGNGELPLHVAHHPPASPEFASYATSWGAENLLSISYQWWHEPAAIRVRYEDLVRDPLAGFSKIVTTLGGSEHQLANALDTQRLAVFQALANRHGWRGTPGLWRDMITPRTALRIWIRHRRLFETFGYRLPLNTTTRDRAIRNWERLR